MILTVAPVTAGSNAVSVPLDDVGGILIVEAKVNGKGPFHFLLDTGAGITIVTPQLAQRLGLGSQSSVTAQGPGGSAAAGMLQLQSVTVGRASRDGVAAAVVDLPAGLTYQGRYGSIDGIIGYSFLKDYAVTIDVKDRRAIFAAHAGQDRSARTIPMSIESSIPVVDVLIDGTRARAKIDSGNNANASITASFAQTAALPHPGSHVQTTQYAGVGGNVTASVTRMNSLTIAGFQMHGVPVTIAQAAPGPGPDADGNLGYAFLKRFIVTFDYPASTLSLAPAGHYDAPFPLNGTGIVPLRRADGTFAINAVTDGTPAKRAGLRAGDVIEAVNGVNTRSMSLGDFKSAVSARPGERITMRLTRGNKKFSAVLVTANF